LKTLRRYIIPGAHYFVTVVTHQREPLLIDTVEFFWKAWSDTVLDAWVIMPEHFHAILLPGDDTISAVMHRFKTRFSRYVRDSIRPGIVWQHRFWDHVIRNLKDMNHHIDYIHFNPVHHGLAASPVEYVHSSFAEYVRQGYYGEDWGKMDTEQSGEYGE
jgi:putative transposase